MSLDKVTDAEQRCLANLVLRILGVEEKRGKSYLLTLKVLDKLNHSQLLIFNNSVSLLYPCGILYEKVLMACTDAALYMCKAMNGLQILD